MSLFGTLKARLIGLLAALTVVLGIYLKGRSDQKEKERVEDLEEYIDTTEKINEVSESDTRDAAVERLRRNGIIR